MLSQGGVLLQEPLRHENTSVWFSCVSASGWKPIEGTCLLFQYYCITFFIIIQSMLINTKAFILMGIMECSSVFSWPTECICKAASCSKKMEPYTNYGFFFVCFFISDFFGPLHITCRLNVM